MTYRSPVLCRQTQRQPWFSGNSHPTVEAVPPSLRTPPNTPWWVMVQQPLISPSTLQPWRMLALTGALLLILWARARIPRPWRSQEVSDGVVVWWLYAQLLENFVSYSKKSGEGNTLQHFFLHTKDLALFYQCFFDLFSRTNCSLFLYLKTASMYLRIVFFNCQNQVNLWYLMAPLLVFYIYPACLFHVFIIWNMITNEPFCSCS